MNEITLDAHAKINLGLDVIRRREDGYHEVKMIMQSISLCDTLVLKKIVRNATQGEIGKIYLHNAEAEKENKDVPMDDQNLIYRAIRMLMEEFEITDSVEAILTKRIPVAAGMAGGSTDGAAAFRGMNELFELGLTDQELCKRAVKLGADIPYCIMGGTALSEGIGEKLTALPSMPKAFILIAKPPINVSTAFVYKNLRVNELKRHPDIDGMVTAIKTGSLSGVTKRMENVLETVTIPNYPVIDEIKKIMKESGGENALMSGSGPTVFGIFTNEEKARTAKAQIEQEGLSGQVYVTTPFNS